MQVAERMVSGLQEVFLPYFILIYFVHLTSVVLIYKSELDAQFLVFPTSFMAYLRTLSYNIDYYNIYEFMLRYAVQKISLHNGYYTIVSLPKKVCH